MAIFFPPIPPVQTGGAQPYGQKKLAPDIIAIQVNNPPFTYGGPFAIKAEVVNINQPNPWVYAYFGALQPFAPRKLNPSITAVAENNPPFTYGGPNTTLVEEAYLAQPNPWVYVFQNGLQPYDFRRTNPSLTAVPENNPPFDRRRFQLASEIININQPTIWPYAFLGWRGPYMQKAVPPSLESSFSFFRVYIFY